MKLNFRILCGAFFAFSTVTSVSANEANILQRGDGNSLAIDQTKASASLVGGVALIGESLTGPFTEAEDIFEAQRGPLVQDSRPGSFESGNVGVVTIASDGGIALMLQLGMENNGVIDLSGSMARGAILQVGNQNEGHVRVTGESSSGALQQFGNDNKAELQVNNGHTVIYSQIGNNMTADSPVTVSGSNSNLGTLSITQY